ncbi:hypothetical protein GFL58_18860 [Rhizobium leguminosarum bv. viciae]|nr:hypothetical protein [Rhizobium leguminosarum bv. viciae]
MSALCRGSAAPVADARAKPEHDGRGCRVLSRLLLGVRHPPNIPHPEVRRPKAGASKDTPQRCSLHPSDAGAPRDKNVRAVASTDRCRRFTA